MLEFILGKKKMKISANIVLIVGIALCIYYTCPLII